jgi:glycosyltransferase involved in cell wall biosynthesis
MAAAGNDVSVYATNVDGRGGVLDVPVEKAAEVGGVSVTYFRSTFGPNSVWDSRGLVRRLDRTACDFDLLYISAVWQQIGCSAARVAHRQHIPFVIGTHGSFDSILLQKGRVKKTAYWHAFLRRCFRRASAIHFTTPYEREQAKLLRQGYPSFIAPNGLSQEAFPERQDARQSLRTEFHIPSEAPVLVTIARPDPKKRIDVLIAALARIVSEVPQCRLLIVGAFTNGYGRRLRAIADEMRLQDNIIWAGYRTGDSLRTCYGGSTLFALPSMDENFGMVVAEAMAAGLPVVVSRNVGIAADIRAYDAGLITEVDPKELAQAILSLLRNPSRLEQMGRSARCAARQLYDSRRVARVTVRAFQDILSGSRSEECQWQ